MDGLLLAERLRAAAEALVGSSLRTSDVDTCTRQIELHAELPKTPVGKIRRCL